MKNVFTDYKDYEKQEKEIRLRKFEKKLEIVKTIIDLSICIVIVKQLLNL